MFAARRADRNGVSVVPGARIGPPNEDIDETGAFELSPLLVRKRSNLKGGRDFGEVSLAVNRSTWVVLCILRHRSPRFLRGLCQPLRCRADKTAAGWADLSLRGTMLFAMTGHCYHISWGRPDDRQQLGAPGVQGAALFAQVGVSIIDIRGASLRRVIENPPNQLVGGAQASHISGCCSPKIVETPVGDRGLAKRVGPQFGFGKATYGISAMPGVWEDERAHPRQVRKDLGGQ